FPDTYCRRYTDRPVLLDEILKGNGKNHTVAEKCPAEEKKGCTEDKRQYQLLLPQRQTWADKAPDLIKNNWTGKKNSPGQGYLYFNKKCFGDRRPDQAVPGTKALSKRGYHKFKNRVRKKITESGS